MIDQNAPKGHHLWCMNDSYRQFERNEYSRVMQCARKVRDDERDALLFSSGAICAAWNVRQLGYSAMFAFTMQDVFERVCAECFGSIANRSMDKQLQVSLLPLHCRCSITLSLLNFVPDARERSRIGIIAFVEDTQAG